MYRKESALFSSDTMSISKSSDPDQDGYLISSDLGPSCLQRLSVYDTSMERGICS